MRTVCNYIDDNMERYVEELFELVRQPSVSTEAEDIKSCAELVAGKIKETGAKVQIVKTEGNPVVFGEIGPSSAERTILFYGHYDIKPPGSLNMWNSPPFKPEIRGDRMYGRGISDDKSGILAHIKAVEALLEVEGKLPIIAKFVYEGEEEVSSPSLKPFLEENKEMLRSDAFLRADGCGHESGRPMVKLGNKGMLSLDLESTMANKDLHSSRAAVVPNPVWELIWALSSMKDRSDQVLIDGFYDKIRDITPQEREVLENMPTGEEELLDAIGLDSFIGDVQGFDYLYKWLYTPTFNISGIESGGPNPLPHRAKLSLRTRLVPDQDPHDIYDKIVRHIEKNNFKIKVTKRGVLYPHATPLDSPFVQTVIESVRGIWGVEPVVMPRGGGSGPYFFFADILNIPLVSVPFSPFDCNAHAPNENMTIGGFENAIKVSATVMNKFRKKEI
jgi:acetylornithine deacetylase/succinyl-diaminopimelate desuccinylase-like protein